MYTNAALLYAEPSFLEGVVRVVDFGGLLNEYNASRTGELADFFATRSDWQAVGDDLRHGLERYAAQAHDR